jgi:hypothetical protein
MTSGSAGAGYSGTPQANKLGLRAGVRWRVVGADPGWRLEAEPEPADRIEDGSPADLVLAFVRSATEVAPMVAELESQIFPAGALWVAWPRKAGGHRSDVDENLIRNTALARDLVDVKVAAIDADWSGLKLVWRRAKRSGPVPG